MEFYKQNIDTVIEQFSSNVITGLNENAILSARKEFGKNTLKVSNTRSVYKILLGQFASPLIIILIVASLASFYLKQPRDGLILLIIVILNALIGFYQEWKSENILASIKKLVVEKCTVIREGKVIEIFAEGLVPGDIVLLSEGVGIPADIRLIESNGFSANEFILTGESLPSSKDHLFVTGKNTSVSEIKNCVFMGTTVARGEAKGIAYATGMQTQIGKISSSSQIIKSTDSPVQKEIKDVAKKLTYATIIIGILLFGTRLVLNDSLGMALVFAVGVAAAMVPQGLPAQISVALALAVGRLAKRKAIVKKIASAQTLGSATVIASDKTGTITKNEMTITGCHFNGMTFSVSGLGYRPNGEILDEQGRVLKKESLGDMKAFFLSGFLSSTGKINPPDKYHPGWYCIGDPTEASFAALAMKAGFSLEEVNNDYPVVKSFGFDSFRKRAAIIRTHNGKVISFIKGSLESVLAASTQIISDGNIAKLTETQKQEIISMSAAFAENALRIIAIAYKDLDGKDDYTIEDAEQDLIFAGFVTMLDPPHEEVKGAIESVFKAHMKVFMITGDNEVTAKAIAKNIGLMNENNEFPDVVNGIELQKMSDPQVCAVFSKRAVIFSRVSPDDKFRIVDLLKKQGEIVAVTGDGVNDTLSLKRADIGVAMGLSGSKVAQEAANIVLLDDNFSTIVVAVKEGRTIFWNLEKNIKINLACNIAELSCVLFGFAGAFMGIATPILAVQILLIDMVGEMFPLMMLTYDPPENNIMENPPRNPNDKILTKDTLKDILFNGIIKGLVAYGAFLAVYFHDHHLADHYEKAITVTFVSIIFGNYANTVSTRTYGKALGKYFFSNTKLLVGFALSIASVMLIVYLPVFNLYFHTSSLMPVDWLFPLAAGVVCLTIYEYRKKRNNRRYKNGTSTS
ncbi:MAG: cation-transporting P-type ATPase [Chitinophagales bacterium]|nr:cation-transporting P-type ATPase [Chitinophagales bacterium]